MSNLVNTHNYLPSGVVGLLSEPIGDAAVRYVEAHVSAGTTVRIDKRHPWWTGAGCVPVTRIEMIHAPSGTERAMIVNSPGHHWQLSDVRAAVRYFNDRVAHWQDGQAQLKAKAAAQEHEQWQRKSLRRARFNEWFDARAIPAKQAHRRRRVVDVQGLVWRVDDKMTLGVRLIAITSAGTDLCKTRLAENNERIAYLTVADERQFRGYAA